MSKKLIINADDYGICPEVNRAIEDLITAGKLQNVSVLTNTRFYEEAAEFLLLHRNCSVGVHLNVVEGVALSPVRKIEVLLDKNQNFIGLSGLLRRWMRSPVSVSAAVDTEWRAQIELLLKSGLTVSHADSHQHIHAFPPFWKIIIKLCREYGIPAVRLPREQNDLQLRSIPAFALTQAANVSKAFISNRNLISNHHFLGFKRAGTYGEKEMLSDLNSLKPGVTELCFHPSVCDGVPYPTLRGKLEFDALFSTRLQKQIAESKIELITWTDFFKSEVSKN